MRHHAPPGSAVVYKKTNAGAKVLASRDASLTPRLRCLLILVNGADSAEVILRRLGLPDSELRLFDQLAVLGFAERHQGNPVVSQTTVADSEDERHIKAKTYLLKVARSLLSDDSHPIVKSVEGAADKADLQVCVDGIRKLIVMLSDRATADNFAAKVQSILG